MNCEISFIPLINFAFATFYMGKVVIIRVKYNCKNTEQRIQRHVFSMKFTF